MEEVNIKLKEENKMSESPQPKKEGFYPQKQLKSPLHPIAGNVRKP